MSKRNGSTSTQEYDGSVIKCFMDDAGPPCRRCKEKKLSNCAVSKNLQTIIDEKTELSEAMLSDLDQMYTAVKEMRAIMGMPELPPLQTSRMNKRKDSIAAQPSESTILQLSEDNNYGPSCDNSPKLTPEDDRLPHAPIHSLYTLTRMRALRSPGSGNDNSSQAINDFISQGQISLPDAERLFCIYRDRLDGYIYTIGCPYKTLDQLRRNSSILCAATLTIAALHDPAADKLYGVCNSELRRLTEKSMLQRQGDRDYFRALSIASYWLSDLSWTLSGHAIRRAAECNIHNSYSLAIKDQSEEAMDSARIWSILYICDQHLAILYDRPAIIQDDWLTQDWEGILNCPLATDQDERLMSQVELMGILRSIRRLFGPDKGEEIPRLYLSQIGHYRRQLDQWITKWTERLPEGHPTIGAFPRKGALFHFHLAQLYLYSHVFRGQSNQIPSHFLDTASMAVTSASAIIDILLTDPDLSTSIVGIPSYLLSMTAFAAMFLAKVSHKYGDELFRRDQALDQITRLINHFRSLSMGKWHLANLMIRGLETVTSLLTSHGVEDKVQNTIHAIMPGTESHGLEDVYNTNADMFTGIDSSTIPTWDTTFGLSPIFGFDPSLLDVDGYMQSMAIFPNAEP
ncbi:Transcriptional activator of proteases prtT [Fusarium austroafricanum]|uniref:Transcriptional activator of proteases prtT n=1 Tax=Fusarium austroafricanum TaxID=2364996 RepID=A0A8H4KDU8_9HYPO|nr:Transcriptional activator of proteases prtT [Fusarium austroafricanum]